MKTKKLALRKETLVNLESNQLDGVVGGTSWGQVIQASIKTCVAAVKASIWLHNHGVLPIRAMNNGPLNAWHQQKANQTKPPR